MIPKMIGDDDYQVIQLDVPVKGWKLETTPGGNYNITLIPLGGDDREVMTIFDNKIQLFYEYEDRTKAVEFLKKVGLLDV